MENVKGYVYNGLNIIDILNERWNKCHLLQSLPNITSKWNYMSTLNGNA